MLRWHVFLFFCFFFSPTFFFVQTRILSRLGLWFPDQTHLCDKSGLVDHGKSPAGAKNLTRIEQNGVQWILLCNMVIGRLQTETKFRPAQLIISRPRGYFGASEYFTLLISTNRSNVVWGCWKWLWVPGVARCLTLTGADDECDLRQPQDLTNSRESQHPPVKVSIFKAHQQQWESCGTACPPTRTARKPKFFQLAYAGEKRLNTCPRSGYPCQTEEHKSEWLTQPVMGLKSSQIVHTRVISFPIWWCLLWFTSFSRSGNCT